MFLLILKIFFNSSLSIDGIDQWESLSKDLLSPRHEALINIDNVWGSSGIIVGDYKLLKGTNYNGAWDNWYGPAGDHNPDTYKVEEILKSPAGEALISINKLPDVNKIR